MKQTYNNYTTEDHAVWKILFDRQHDFLQATADRAYLDCLEALNPVLNEEAIPRITDLNEQLLQHTGWSIAIVPGMIPVKEFFELLKEKKFCSSTWVRSRDKLDYLEEPDMFHDIFGHIPLLIDPGYSAFTETLGKLGVQYAAYPEIIAQLQRLYWFTLEFGVIREPGRTKVYGAGICSSHGETKHVLSPGTEIRPFDLEQVLEHPFNNTEIQTIYYAVQSLDELKTCIPELEAHCQRQASVIQPS